MFELVGGGWSEPGKPFSIGPLACGLKFAFDDGRLRDWTSFGIDADGAN